MRVPGTTPDYWMTVDDRITATMLDLLDGKPAKDKPAKRRQTGRRRRGNQ